VGSKRWSDLPFPIPAIGYVIGNHVAATPATVGVCSNSVCLGANARFVSHPGIGQGIAWLLIRISEQPSGVTMGRIS